MNVKFTISLIMLIFLCSLTSAQEAIPVAGGAASGSNGTVDYSIGQLYYSVNSGTNGSAAEGVQQAFEISIISEIKKVKGISLECSLYPNPVVESLELKVGIEDISNSSFSIQVFDINGKLIQSKILELNETTIDMRNLDPATYFLKLSDNRKELRTFKIIKK